MHWYATPTASLGHMYVVPVINKAYATARVVGQARLLVFISFPMVVLIIDNIYQNLAVFLKFKPYVN